jgi:trehalose synthase
VVCATKVGEIPLYLEDGISAYLAEPGSSNSFAMALRQCLSDTGKAQEIGKNGREVARKYFNMNLQAKELSVFLRLL